MFVEGHDGPTLDEASVSEFKVEDLPALGFPTSPISGSRGMLEGNELMNETLATERGEQKARESPSSANVVLEGPSSILEISSANSRCMGGRQWKLGGVETAHRVKNGVDRGRKPLASHCTNGLLAT